MNAIRQIVDSDALTPLIKLPKSFAGKRVEVIVLPLAEGTASNSGKKKMASRGITRAQLERFRATSSATKLTGSISHPYMTIQEIRAERFNEQYDSLD
jgi:hypothetical protein